MSKECSLPKLEYALPVKSKVVLEVYDIAGDRIMTLVDETKSAGQYIYDLNTSQKKLNHGTYYCRMAAYDDSARAQYVNVRKLTVAASL
ncbi:MAG: hypothetical protein HYV28_03325 [Ignavibacteriales bacterium]|nr:hypothetical protein [Ignavibacteriales bacterium]